MSQKRQSWKYPEDMTDRQWHFVAQYALHGNGAKAARNAGYAKASARKTASRLMTYKYIRQALKWYTVEQITQCKRPLRKALRNLERQEPTNWNQPRTEKLLRRLIDLIEPDSTLRIIDRIEEPKADRTLSFSTPSNPPLPYTPPVELNEKPFYGRIAHKMRRP